MIAALCIALLPQAAGAQRDIAAEWFGLYGWKGNLFVRGKTHLNDHSPGGTNTRETGWMFEQGLELGTGGYVYHPNLLQWQGFFRIGASQEQARIEDETNRTEGSLLGYSLTAMVLRQKPIRLRLFANQAEDLRDRGFSGSVKAHTNSQGAELILNGLFPSSVLLERLERHEDEDFRTEKEQTYHLRFTTNHRPNLDWHTQLVYDHYDTEEEATFESNGPGRSVTQDLPDEINEINVTNLWRFGGAGKPISMNGRIRAMERQGFFPNRLFTIEQQMDWKHTETFSTFYRAMFNHNETNEQTDRAVTGEVGLRRSFYESLNIELRGLAGRSEFGEVTEDTYGAFLNADYRKRTPIGHYTTTLMVGREWQSEKSPLGLIFIQDRSILLVDTSFSPLRQENADPASVVVTNLDKTEVYDLGTDYILRTTGVMIEIARVANGDINDGQAVSVSFSASVATDAEFTTDHLVWTHRLRATHLPLVGYIEYRSRDESLTNGDDPGDLDTVDDLLFGLEYTYHDLVATVEHQIVDQELSPPWTADRVSLVYSRTLSPTLAVSASGHAERLRYDDGARFGLVGDETHLDMLSAQAHVTAKLRRNLLMRFRSGIIDTRGRETRTTFTNEVSLKWQYGKLGVSADARYDTFTQERTSGQAFSLMFNVTRSF